LKFRIFLRNKNKLESDLKTTGILAEVGDDHGHYGSATCRHCGVVVPEPYYKQIGKKCGDVVIFLLEKKP